MASSKASDVFIECLENEGVTRIFGVPGEENADLMMSIERSSIERRHLSSSSRMSLTLVLLLWLLFEGDLVAVGQAAESPRQDVDVHGAGRFLPLDAGDRRQLHQTVLVGDQEHLVRCFI